MIKENKVSKYLLYAIGEIILIVIGILIALMLNTQKELNTNRTQIEGIIKGISKNLENDMKSVTELIKMSEKFDSLAKNILAKKLTASDYEGDLWSNEYIRLTRGTVETVQFESNAYDRLMGNIEIIPEKYNAIVVELQRVYGVEVPISIEVENDFRAYLNEIENKLRNTYDWYSMTDSIHYQQQINYYLNNPQYFNDVSGLQRHVIHLNGHLDQLKVAIAVAYNKIHQELLSNSSFSEHIEQFEFTEPEELIEYLGKYKLINIKSAPYVPDTLTVETKNYYLNISPMNFIAVKKDKDKFGDVVGTDIQFNFKRDEDGNIYSFEATHKMQDRDSILTDVFEKIK
ncbi:MAG: hypothetical protein KAJ28_11605 [Flavobacteriaceae bacterium]|nr:hypothetical protein [Flavobacteriaceae bacterium]